MSKIYKIRNKETGKFSKGGSSSYNIWTKEGKSWSSLGHLKNHLHLFIDYKGDISKDYPYQNAEVIEVEIKYEQCFRTDVNLITEQLSNDLAELDEKYEMQQRKWEEERDRKLLRELKEKYE